MFSFITNHKKTLSIALSIVCVMFFFVAGINNGFTNAAVQEKNNILKAMDETSKLYVEKSALILRERSHCSYAQELETELTKLQALNASRRRQLQLIDLSTGETKKD